MTMFTNKKQLEKIANSRIDMTYTRAERAVLNAITFRRSLPLTTANRAAQRSLMERGIIYIDERTGVFHIKEGLDDN